MQLSVLIPARNAGRTLGRALTSTLRAAPRDTEVLVLDDASTDSTAVVARNIDDPRMRVLRSQQALGVASALNELLAEAKGDFVARMDADDIVLPGRFEAQLKRLRSGADLTFGGVVHFGEGLRAPYPSPPLRISSRAFPVALLMENPVAHSTMAARAESIKTLGGYRPCLAEDYDLWLRAARNQMTLERSARPLTALRRHRGQVTATREWAARAAAEAEWQDAYSELAEHVLPLMPSSLSDEVRAAASTREKRRLLAPSLERASLGLDRRDRAALGVLARRASRG